MSLPGFFSPPQIWTVGGNVNAVLAQPDPRVGDLMVATIAVRPSTVTIAAPAGWTATPWVDQVGTDGLAEGADTGSVRFYIFTKVADGTEGNATVTFTKTGTGSVILGNIQQVRSATGTYDILALAASINGDTTSWSAPGLGAAGDFVADDLVLMYAAQNGDVSNTSGWDFFGADLGASTKTVRYEHGEFSSTTGNDIEVGMAVSRVLPGTSNTSTVTLNVNQSVACSGVIAALRIRQGAGTERDDVYVRGTGVQLAGSTSIAVPYVEHEAGDKLLLAVVSRISTGATPATPTNWTPLGSWNGGSGVFGVDAGDARVTIFERNTTAIIQGTQTVTLTSGNVMIGQMVAIAKPSAETWDTTLATGGGRTVQDPWSLALDDSIAFPTDAVCLAVFGINTDAMTGIQNPTMSAPGVTFGDVTATGWWESTTGNDAAIGMATGRVASGGTGVPTVGVDFTGTAAANYPAGAIGLVVVSMVPSGPTDTELIVADARSSSTIDAVALTQHHLLVVDDARSASTADAPTLQVVTALDPADARSASAIDAIALSQLHLLAPADARSPSAVDAIVLAQAHALDVEDARSPATVDDFALEQQHLVVAADASSTSTVDPVSLAQQHLLATADARSASAIDAVVLAQAHTIDVADARAPSAVDSVTLAQQHLLAPADAWSASAIDTPSPTQQHLLAVADARSPSVVAAVALTQAHGLAVDDARSASAVDGVTISQVHLLAVADAAAPSTIDGVTVTQQHLLAVADARSASTIDDVTLQAAGSLLVDDARSASAIGNVALTQAHTLAVDDARSPSTVDSPTPIVLAVLTVDDARSPSTIGHVELTQAHLLNVDDARSPSAVDGVTLTANTVLAVDDAMSASLIDDIALMQAHILIVDPASSTSTIDGVSLAQAHLLIVDHARSASTVDHVTLIVIGQIPLAAGVAVVRFADARLAAVYSTADIAAAFAAARAATATAAASASAEFAGADHQVT